MCFEMSELNQHNLNGDNVAGSKFIFVFNFFKNKYLQIAAGALFFLFAHKFTLSAISFFLQHYIFLISFLIISFFLRKIIHPFLIIFLIFLSAIPLFYFDISKKGEGMYGVCFVGCIDVNQNGEFVLNDLSLNKSKMIFLDLLQNSKKHNVFKSGGIDILKIDIPFFILKIIGQKGIDYLLKFRQDEYHIFDFYCVISQDKAQINTLIDQDNFYGTNLIESTFSELSKSSKKMKFEDFSDLSSTILISILGQCYIQQIYKELKNYQLAHAIANDSERLMEEAIRISNEYVISDEFRVIINVWLASISREKFFISIEQANYSEAIKYYCKAIEYCSSFPCLYYEDFKRDYSRSYYKTIGEIAIDSLDANRKLIEYIYTNNVTDEIGFLIESYNFLPKEYMSQLLHELKLIRKKNDPIYWLLMSKVVKYVQPDARSNMYNEIFSYQLINSSAYLDSALLIDPKNRFFKSLKELYSIILNSENIAPLEKIQHGNIESEFSEMFNDED